MQVLPKVKIKKNIGMFQKYSKSRVHKETPEGFSMLIEANVIFFYMIYRNNTRFSKRFSSAGDHVFRQRGAAYTFTHCSICHKIKYFRFSLIKVCRLVAIFIGNIYAYLQFKRVNLCFQHKH